LFIGTTHIGLGIEANELVELVENVKPFKPLIITGDFNSTPDSAAMATIYKHSDLVDSWQAVSKGDGFTFNSSTPTKRIDYVLARGINAVQATVIDTQASDHRPLLVQF
jgi:endonuclease/exonuclease/phosphatase (EEP) superfamily protein YafD